jgi:hypothetical protein
MGKKSARARPSLVRPRRQLACSPRDALLRAPPDDADGTDGIFSTRAPADAGIEITFGSLERRCRVCVSTVSIVCTTWSPCFCALLDHAKLIARERN